MCITRILKKSFLLISMILWISHIYAIELNSTNITQSPFSCPIESSYCWLSGKGITSIAPWTFDNHTGLVTLDLSFNQLTELPAWLFDYTPNLLQFAVYYNQLTSIPSWLFDHTPDLDYFSPASNQLSTLPAWLFDHTPNLRNFNIAINKLTYLPDDLFLNIPAFNSFRIDDNKLTTIPTSLTTITNINTLRVANNCMVLSNMSDWSIDYLNAHAIDNPIWSSQQYGCSVDFWFYLNFINNPIRAWLSNILQLYVYQYSNNVSTWNYLEIYGLDNIWYFPLSENIWWSNPSSWIYRYVLPDYTWSVSDYVYLNGILKQSVWNSFVTISGEIFSNTHDKYTPNNIVQNSFYVFPTTNYQITSWLNEIWQSGDIKTLSIDYGVLNNDFSLSDSLVVVNLWSWVSMFSSGWSNTYDNWSLLITWDICYDELLNEQWPYYASIKSLFISMWISSINNWLVSNFWYVSDPSMEIEHLMDACISYMWHNSFYQCMNDMWIYITKDNYPQCWWPKSFAHTWDVCYADFLQEQWSYYNDIKNYIINNYWYTSIWDWLMDRFGIVSSPSDYAENIENVCLSYFGYSDLSRCLQERFNVVPSNYSTCGYDELPSLLIKLLPVSFSGQFDVQLQLNKNIISWEYISSEFNFYPSLLDIDSSNNKFIYNLFPITVVQTWMSSFWWWWGSVNNNCSSSNTNNAECNTDAVDTWSYQISFLDSDLYNDTIANGYCYNRKPIVSIFNSLSHETTDEFKKSLWFMYSYGLTKYDSIDEFNPYISLTREQAAKIFSLFAINVLCRKVDSSLNIIYKDFNNIDSWLSTYVKKAYQLGLMKWWQDGYFRPKDYITKAEFNAVLVRMILKTYLPEDNSDVWYSEYNKISKSLGIVKYGASSTSITRNDVAIMLFRTYKNYSFSLQNINYNSYVLFNRESIIPFHSVDQSTWTIILSWDFVSDDSDIKSWNFISSIDNANISVSKNRPKMKVRNLSSD